MYWRSILADRAACRSSVKPSVCRLAKLAMKTMVGKSLPELGLTEAPAPAHLSVKESVFPFNKFPGVDVLLGPR